MMRRAGVWLVAASLAATGAYAVPPNPPHYGLIGRIVAKPGKSVPLIAALVRGTRRMPGCLSYIVAQDRKDPNVIWVTEVWDKPESHAASLKLPEVRRAIEEGRPLIARMDTAIEVAVAPASLTPSD